MEHYTKNKLYDFHEFSNENADEDNAHLIKNMETTETEIEMQDLNKKKPDEEVPSELDPMKKRVYSMPSD